MILSQPDLRRRSAAEALGTGFLLAVVVGSGIMADHLSGGSVGLALLANSIATGAGLTVLILALGPISGAHFNPAVTLSLAFRKMLPWREVPAYVVGQFVGAFLGTATANLMFEEPAFSLARRVRSGPAQVFSEIVATFGLLTVIWACSRRRPNAAPFAIGGYITAAYWFTASTSFANPAVTLARAFTDTFTGIRPMDVPGFVMAQLIGAAGATLFFHWLDGSHSEALHEIRADLGHPRQSAGAGSRAAGH